MKIGLAVTNRGAAGVAEIRLMPRALDAPPPPADAPAQSSGPKAIGTLLPQVLSRYGLTSQVPLPNEVDLWA
jgi:hypothetical protein